MSLNAFFQADSGINILKLEGRIDYETANTLEKQIKKTKDVHEFKHLIIDMKSIDFIGSTNLRSFFEMLTQFAMNTNIRVILTGVDDNFLRVFKLFQKGPMSIEFEQSEEKAKNLFRMNH